MSEDDRPNSTVEERISRARERMSMDYDDKPAPRPATGNKLAGNSRLMELVTSFLGSESGTRRLAYGAAGLGGLLVLGIGGWAVLGHHQSGIPVLGPPPVAMRTKPVDPGGMQLDTLALPEADANVQGHPVPAPETPNPAALAAQYGAQATPAPAANAAPGTPAGAGKAATAAGSAAQSTTEEPATPEPAISDPALAEPVTPDPALADTAAQADGGALKPVPSATLPEQGAASPDATTTAPEPLKDAPIPTDDASDGEEEAAPAPKAVSYTHLTLPTILLV